MIQEYSEDIQDIINKIELYRIEYNKPQDEKVRPLLKAEIDRLPKIPDHWVWMTSNDISTFITNGVHSPTSTKDELGINKRMVRITDIDDAGFADFSNLPFCQRFVKGDYDKTLKKNDIYISFTGNVLGKRYLVKEDKDDVVYAHYFVRWQPIVVDPGYIYYVLLSKNFTSFMDAYKIGSTQPNLKVTDLKRVPLPIAPLNEQKRIAKILGDLDKKIELNRQTNQTLEQIALAIFKSWFVDFEPVKAKIKAKQNGADPVLAAMRAISGKTEEQLKGLDDDVLQQLKTTATLFPEVLVESDMGEVPKGWDVGTLDNVCDLNKLSWTKQNSPDEIWYVDLANTKNGVIEDTQYYSWQDAPSRAKRVLSGGDTIIGTVRPGNRSFAFIGAMDKPLTASTGFAVLTPAQPEYTEFVFVAATSNENIDRLAHLADGGAYPAVRPDVVTSMELVIPSAAIIIVFNSITKTLFEQRDKNLVSGRTLKKLRDSLLPKLLSGELETGEAASFNYG